MTSPNVESTPVTEDQLRQKAIAELTATLGSHKASLGNSVATIATMLSLVFFGISVADLDNIVQTIALVLIGASALIGTGSQAARIKSVLNAIKIVKQDLDDAQK